MAWYQDSTATSQVQGYSDERAADKDLREAAKYGWTMRDLSGTFGQVPVGRTMTKVAVVTGTGILFPVGAGGRLSITWERTPEMAKVIGEEDAANAIKLEYDQAGGLLYQCIARVADIQARNSAGPRNSDVAKAYASALMDRSRAAQRRIDACIRLAAQIEVLLNALAGAGETEPPPINVAVRLREEANSLDANAAADETAALAMQDFVAVCRESEDAIKAAQDSAKNIGQNLIKIADAERRALSARDDAARQRAEQEVADRKAANEQESLRLRDLEADRDAKQAALAARASQLPTVVAY